MRLTIGLAGSLIGVSMAWSGCGGGTDQASGPTQLAQCKSEETTKSSPMNLQSCWLDKPQPELFMVWNDQQGEYSYLVSGYIDYWPDRCKTSPAAKASKLEFSEDLAADTTFYKMPRPLEPGAVFAKEFKFNIQGVDESGSVIASDGTSAIVDPFGC
jgi:hypothetical protein